MSKLHVAGFSGLLIAATLVGGTLISSVAAATAPSPGTPVMDVVPAAVARSALDTEAAAKRCADFRKAFAANLGVEESALTPAAKKAAISTIDAAIAAGTTTKAAGDRLKARVEAADADACRLLAGGIGAPRAGAAARAALGLARDGVTAAATALGMTPAELGAKLRAGETLTAIATAKGVPYATVSAAVVAAVKGDLDAAVAAGTIRQARADRILERLTKNLADGRLRNVRPATPVDPADPAAPGTGG